MLGVMQTIQATYDKLDFSLEDLEKLAAEMLKEHSSEELINMNYFNFNKAVNKAVKKVELTRNLNQELFKIFENYTLEDVPSVVKKDMIKTLNTEGAEFNSFLVQALRLLTETLEALEEGNSIIAASEIEVILAMEFTAKNLVLIIENEKEEFKILPAELDSILVNAKSILNAVATIRKLQTKKLKELTPEELLVALTT